MEGNYKLYINPWEIDRLQKVEREIFNVSIFEYNRDILVFPFEHRFDNYYFLVFNNLFRKEKDYRILSTFLTDIRSSSFFISAPPYAVLYPLEVSADCPFSIYENAPAYGIEEVMDSGTRPLQHPRRGTGFASIPDVFMYDMSEQWAILNNDSNLITIIGINDSIKDKFEAHFFDLNLLSVWEATNVMETFQTGIMSTQDKETFVAMFDIK